MRYPVTKVLGAAAALTVLSAGMAHADNINDDIQDSGSVTIAAGSTGTANIKVVSVGNVQNNPDGDPGCNIDSGESLTLSFNTPSGVSVDPLTMTLCDVFYGITINTTSAAQSGVITASITGNTTGAGTYNNNVGIPVTITGGGNGVVTPVNAAPTVATPAPDASGAEGSELSTGGTFADDGGAGNLTVVQVSGAGTVTQTAAQVTAGSWTWTHTPQDNFTDQPVVVKATDAQGLYVTDEFSWSSTNVAPTVSGLVANVTSLFTGSSVTYTAGTTTDPSQADTTAGFTYSFSDGAYGASNSVTRTYTSCGAQSESVVAQDKDGGESAPQSADVNVYDGGWHGAIKPAVRNQVQAGRVVPVQIQVGCAGVPLTGLTPGVRLVAGDVDPDTTAFDAAVGTSTSSSAADTTGFMRPTADGYIYNLQIPSSAKAGDLFTVAVRPWGSDGTQLRAVIQIRR